MVAAVKQVANQYHKHHLGVLPHGATLLTAVPILCLLQDSIILNTLQTFLMLLHINMNLLVKVQRLVKEIRHVKVVTLVQVMINVKAKVAIVGVMFVKEVTIVRGMHTVREVVLTMGMMPVMEAILVEVIPVKVTLVVQSVIIAQVMVAEGGRVVKAMKREHVFLSSLVQTAGLARLGAVVQVGATTRPTLAGVPAVLVALRQTKMVSTQTPIITTQLKSVAWQPQGC